MSKYSKLAGIHSLHDFVFVKQLISGIVVCKVGSYATLVPLKNQSKFKLVVMLQRMLFLMKQRNFHENKLRTLSDTKLSHLRQICPLSFLEIADYL